MKLLNRFWGVGSFRLMLLIAGLDDNETILKHVDRVSNLFEWLLHADNWKHRNLFNLCSKTNESEAFESASLCYNFMYQNL